MGRGYIKSFFGDKNFYKQVTAVALPVMAQQLVTACVNLVDNVMVGGVGQNALTAVTVANCCYMLVNSLLFGLTGGAGIFIAQHYGAKNEEKCQSFFNLSLLLSILIAAFATFVLLLAPEWTIYIFTRTPEIAQLGLDYVKFVRFSYVPYAISVTCIMAMRSIGLNKIQLKVGTLTVVTNSVLNLILIYGYLGMPAMGVKGAALATLIARVLEMGIYLMLLIRKTHFYRLDIKGMFQIDSGMLKQLIEKALPLTINELVYSVGNSVIFKAYMRTNEILVAAISIVDTVMNIAFIIFGGLSSSISIFIGGKLGAGRLEEAKQDAKKIVVFAVLVATGIGCIMFAAAPYIHHLYTLTEDAKEALRILLRIRSVFLPMYIIHVSTFFILRAGGDTLSTLLIDSGFLWAGPVLLSTLLSLFTDIGLIELFLAVQMLEVVKMFFAVWLLKKGRWVRNLAEE